MPGDDQWKAVEYDSKSWKALVKPMQSCTTTTTTTTRPELVAPGNLRLLWANCLSAETNIPRRDMHDQHCCSDAIIYASTCYRFDPGTFQWRQAQVLQDGTIIFGFRGTTMNVWRLVPQTIGLAKPERFATLYQYPGPSIPDYIRDWVWDEKEQCFYVYPKPYQGRFHKYMTSDHKSLVEGYVQNGWCASGYDWHRSSHVLLKVKIDAQTKDISQVELVAGGTPIECLKKDHWNWADVDGPWFDPKTHPFGELILSSMPEFTQHPDTGELFILTTGVGAGKTIVKLDVNTGKAKKNCWFDIMHTGLVWKKLWTTPMGWRNNGV